MQPYFFPYPGYFRLLALSDIFVFLDDVQFPRNGWVHRNKFQYINSNQHWLTIPLIKGERDTTKIMDLQYRKEDENSFNQKIRNTKFLSKIPKEMINFDNNVVDDLMSQIKFISDELNFKPDFMRSSNLNLPISLHGQERIIEICKRIGAHSYLNLSGGKDYYNESMFRKADLQLDILTPYSGSMNSIVDVIFEFGNRVARDEILKYSII